MKRFCAIVLAVVMLVSMLAFTGCSKKDDKMTIGIAIYSMGADSCVLLVEDAKAAAEEYGWEIMLLDANGDPAVQADQMATLVSAEVDAIILNPTDTTSLLPSIKAANEAGIPVCGVGMEMDQASMDELLFFAGIDDYSLAYSGSSWIAENYNGQGASVALITGNAGTDPTGKTINAFNAAFEGTDIVSLGDYAADYDTAKAMAITEDLLVEHPEIQAIFCQDHVMAAGAAEAISDAGKTGEVAVVATVGVTDYLSYVEDDLITSAAYVLLWKAGSFAINTLKDYFDNGTELAAKYYADPVMITKDNLATAESVEFVFSPAK